MESGQSEKMGLRTPGQLLEAHRSDLYPGTFSIQRLSNFRAQMKRAVTLVRAAFHKEKVFRKRSTLLVIGGGISGAAAALEAAEKGMVVTLIESERNLLSVQRKCATRWMHPYEYDWPLAHYSHRKFPSLAKDKKICPRLMHWQAGVASRIATNMGDRILARAPSSLNFQLSFTRIPVSLKTLREDFDPGGDFEFILICTGAREAIDPAKFARFASFRYWENDPLEELHRSRRKRNIRRILLSGGGDGVLQDFLRIVHHTSERHLFSAGELLSKKLLPALKRSPEFLAWVRKKQGNCRSFRPDPGTMWRELHEVLDAIERNADCWDAVCPVVWESVESTLTTGARDIQVAFPRKHFSEAFTLNAFLVLLTARATKRGEWLRPNCSLEKIISATTSHRCVGRPKNCCGQLHQVTFQAKEGKSIPAEEFDLIILRHGVEHDAPDLSQVQKIVT